MKIVKRIGVFLATLILMTSISCGTTNGGLDTQNTSSSSSESLESSSLSSSENSSITSSSQNSSSSVENGNDSGAELPPIEEPLPPTEYEIDGKIFYGIATEEAFLQMEETKNYLLETDLDFEGMTIEPIASFSGIFEGNGYSLSNITMSAPWPADSTTFGLFTNLSGTLRNVAFENIVRKATITPANPHIGMIYNSGLIAQTLSGRIENVYIRGEFVGYNTCWTPWCDYRDWLKKDEFSGVIAARSVNATIHNVIVNVEYESRYDSEYAENTLSMLVGRGKVNLGNYYVVKRNDQENLGFGKDEHNAIRNTWQGIGELGDMIPSMKEKLDPSVWDISKNSMPTLIPDCALPL